MKFTNESSLPRAHRILELAKEVFAEKEKYSREIKEVKVVDDLAVYARLDLLSETVYISAYIPESLVESAVLHEIGHSLDPEEYVGTEEEATGFVADELQSVGGIEMGRDLLKIAGELRVIAETPPEGLMGGPPIGEGLPMEEPKEKKPKEDAKGEKKEKKKKKDEKKDKGKEDKTNGDILADFLDVLDEYDMDVKKAVEFFNEAIKLLKEYGEKDFMPVSIPPLPYAEFFPKPTAAPVHEVATPGVPPTMEQYMEETTKGI